VLDPPQTPLGSLDYSPPPDPLPRFKGPILLRGRRKRGREGKERAYGAGKEWWKGRRMKEVRGGEVDGEGVDSLARPLA